MSASPPGGVHRHAPVPPPRALERAALAANDAERQAAGGPQRPPRGPRPFPTRRGPNPRISELVEHRRI